MNLVGRSRLDSLGRPARTRKLLVLGVLLCLLLPGQAAGSPALAQQPVRIIWLHHSCGQNLIDQGAVREGLTSLGYEFYDHGYNDEGLRLADGSYAGLNYDVPGDNTDPDGLATIFGQPLKSPADNTFSHLMEYDVIAFKSCFPVSNIGSDEQLAEYQSYYRLVRDRIAQHPDKLFITVTQPPQVPGASEAGEAARARALADWLGSDDYLADNANLVTFDFFDYLAGEDNLLRPEYRMDDYDAHPNERANREIGPLFVGFVDQAIRGYDVRPAPAAPQAAASTPSPPPEPQADTAAPAPASGPIDDFEMGDLGWEAGHDDTGSSVACSLDNAAPHGGSASLRAEYDIVPGGWGGCTYPYESIQNWSAGEGLSLWVRADATGQRIALMVFAGDPMAATPFELFFQTKDGMVEDWIELVFHWSDFGRAQWADPSGLSELDPAQIVGYGFGLGLDENYPGGVLWVDDINLASGQAEAVGPVEPSSGEEAAGPVVEESTVAAEPAAPSTEEQSSAAEAPTPGARAVFPEATAPSGQASGDGICPMAAMLSVGACAMVLANRRRGTS
jgi:hypothetical protein